jgi:hypothetical protein
MRDVGVQRLVTAFLMLLGAGFLIANARVLVDYLIFRRRRAGALLVWPGPRAPYHGMAVAIGVVLGLLIVYKLLVLRQQVFGETMMFAYYVYLLPLSRRIGRGFYEEGIWADRAFIRYHDVGGISWREGEHDVTLIVISRLRNLARRLIVPVDKYSAARRLLREKIGQRTIQLASGGLDLAGHDERDDV